MSNEIGRALDELEQLMNRAPRRINQVRRVVNGALEASAAVAETLQPAVRLYRETHGGQSPNARARFVEVPDESGGPLVELGSLTSVSYLTNKDRSPGRSRRPDLFVHDFERPYPVLAFRTRSRELVIVRASSGYTVREEGIEG